MSESWDDIDQTEIKTVCTVLAHKFFVFFHFFVYYKGQAFRLINEPSLIHNLSKASAMFV